MIWNIFKGLILGFLLFVFSSFLWYLFDTSHIKTLSVKKCEHAAGQSLKALSEQVKDSWFERKHNDIYVFSDGYPFCGQSFQKSLSQLINILDS